jgi:hypothetical protein
MRIVRIVLAVTVALWMAGAGCMLGCENNVAAAAASSETQQFTSSTIVASGDACAAHSRDCCARHRSANESTHGSKHGVEPATNPALKSGKSAAKPADRSASALASSLETTPSNMDSCPLAVNATAALSKVGREHSNSVYAVTPVNASLSNSTFPTIALSPPLRLPNRGHTYLHCCVFLI